MQAQSPQRAVAIHKQRKLIRWQIINAQTTQTRIRRQNSQETRVQRKIEIVTAWWLHTRNLERAISSAVFSLTTLPTRLPNMLHSFAVALSLLSEELKIPMEKRRAFGWGVCVRIYQAMGRHLSHARCNQNSTFCPLPPLTQLHPTYRWGPANVKRLIW